MTDHPDAELLRLGGRFDAAIAVVKKLAPQRRRLFAAYERIADERGIAHGDMSARKKVMAEVGFAQAQRESAAPTTEAVACMKAIHRIKPTTIEGIAVKLRAICFDFADFDERNMDLRNGDVAEVQLGRLMKHVQKLANGRAMG